MNVDPRLIKLEQEGGCVSVNDQGSRQKQNEKQQHGNSNFNNNYSNSSSNNNNSNAKTETTETTAMTTTIWNKTKQNKRCQSSTAIASINSDSVPDTKQTTTSRSSGERNLSGSSP